MRRLGWCVSYLINIKTVRSGRRVPCIDYWYDMSGRQDSRRHQTAGQASIFSDATNTKPGGNSSEAVVVRASSLHKLHADAYNARRERDHLATKVALLAYKLQMNSHDRRYHNHQLRPANFCGRLVQNSDERLLFAGVRKLSS